MPPSEFAGRSPGRMPPGACRAEDPELFFPIAASGPALTEVFAAKAVCLRRAVRTACLSFALATGQEGGGGGTTQEERGAIRRPFGLPAPEHSAWQHSQGAAARQRGNPGGQ